MSSDPDRPSVAQGSADAVPDALDEALDEALAATFPASDAINLNQWSELGVERGPRETAMPTPAILLSVLDTPPPDRTELCLMGPTAFCA